jgi:glyoxylase-like metal-dependent hydrolase (beta-lactamase superfamily II)
VLFLESRRVLFTGDTLVTHNPLTGRTGPQVMPSGFNRDTAQAFASLSALENLNAETIFPAHGDPWHGPIGHGVQLARAAGPS